MNEALQRLIAAGEELIAALKAMDPAVSPDVKPAESAKSGKKTEKAVPVPDYTEIASAIGKLVTVKGRDRAIAVLADFGAKSGKDLKPAQYATFLSTVKAETVNG